jgi:hypothetical protein
MNKQFSVNEVKSKKKKSLFPPVSTHGAVSVCADRAIVVMIEPIARLWSIW